MNLSQEVDSIIAEENINDSVPAVAPDEQGVEQNEQTPANDKPAEGEPSDTNGDTTRDPSDPVNNGESADKPLEKEDSEVGESTVVTPKATQVSTAPVQFDESKIFDEQGNARPFTEVVKVGEYLASQIQPVEVVGKDGKTYQFNTIHDVEAQFPDGFEAKNNMEKLKFESAIVANDNKFREAVGQLKQAEQEYQQYTASAIETRQANENIAKEYRAMADQGLVPKVGDPNDPKFSESPAVKELNKLIAWRDATNAKNAEKGLGQIQSLYVAKQLMDAEGSKVEKEDKSKQIHQERVEVASLSSSPTPDTGKKPQQAYIPMSRLADEIIASENLK